MKHLIKILFTLSLIGIFLGTAFSQEKGEKGSNNKTAACFSGKNRENYVNMIVRTAPKLTLEFSGFYNYGIFELSSNDNGDFNPEEFLEGENFGVRHGVGGDFVAKIPLHEKGNVRLNISGMYSCFSSKYDKIAIGQEVPSYVKYSVFSGGLGIENNFTPNHKFKTLVGIGLIASVISGSANIYENNANKEINILPAFRMGIQIFSGVEYLLNERFGLNGGFKFNHANLWFKDTKESDNPNEINLNDKRVTPRIPYSGWKQFAWGSFYGGVSIYFGIEKKSYTVKNF